MYTSNTNKCKLEKDHRKGDNWQSPLWANLQHKTTKREEPDNCQYEKVFKIKPYKRETTGNHHNG